MNNIFPDSPELGYLYEGFSGVKIVNIKNEVTKKSLRLKDNIITFILDLFL